MGQSKRQACLRRSAMLETLSDEQVSQLADASGVLRWVEFAKHHCEEGLKMDSVHHLVHLKSADSVFFGQGKVIFLTWRVSYRRRKVPTLDAGHRVTLCSKCDVFSQHWLHYLQLFFIPIVLPCFTVLLIYLFSHLHFEQIPLRLMTKCFNADEAGRLDRPVDVVRVTYSNHSGVPVVTQPPHT